MKMQDYDIGKENINIQDMLEEVRSILNLGKYEMKVISASYPTWSEGVDGIPVLSIFGATRRLFISDTSAANKWVYVTLTEL